MAKEISLVEYANKRGCTEASVRYAIKTGKIKKAIIKKNGRTVGIDPDVADKEWKENYNSAKIRNHDLLNSLHGTHEKKKVSSVNAKVDKNGQMSVSLNELEEEEFPEDEDESTISISEAKRRETVLKGKLLQIELIERSKQVISSEEVRKALYEFGSSVKNEILTVPDKIIDDLLASETRNEAYLILKKALNDALETLASEKVKIKLGI